MANAHLLRLRLFVEGVEIPIVAANVVSQADTPAACSIQILPMDAALEFKPRSLVHVFFYDFYHGAPSTSRARIAGDGVSVSHSQYRDPELDSILPAVRFDSSPQQENEDKESKNWRLLFGGEITGVQHQKNPTQRSMILQCLDFSSYWDYAFQYQVSGFSMGGGGIRAAFTGASTTVFNSFLRGSGDIILSMIATPPRSYPQLRGTLQGGLMHIIEAIGGTYYGTRAVRGTNDFFSLAEMRLHLTQMVGANPFSGEDERRLLRAHGFGSLFSRKLAGLGKQVAIRAVLNALQQFIFHQIIPITSPHFVPSTQDPNLPQFETVSLEDDAATRPLARAASTIKDRAQNLLERQQSATTPDSARALSRERGGLARELRSLQRLSDNAGARARRVGIDPSSSGEFSSIYDAGPEVSQKFAATTTNFQGITQNTRRGQRNVTTNTFYPPDSRAGQAVVRMCTQIISDMNHVLATNHRKRVQRATSQPDPPPRLLTQIWRPDVWMVAPPRCNVIFPELYNSFSYSRDYLKETTRLMLRTHSAFFGSDMFFDGFYMAPSRALGTRTGRSLGRGRVGSNSPDISDAPAWFIRDLMDHELYSGIIPEFQRMSDLNLHAIRGGSIEINGVRVGYAQLACNHIFFQRRFQTRQMTVDGKFNPFVVLGFPAVVIDKYKPRTELTAGEYEAARTIVRAQMEGEGGFPSNGDVPGGSERDALAVNTRALQLARDLIDIQPDTQYLGTPTSITHSLAAGGQGTTSIQMGYSRTTNEKTEFLGDTEQQGGSRFTRTHERTVTSIVAWTSPPSLTDRGPTGGEILSVTDVTDQYQRRREGQRAPSRRRTVRGSAALPPGPTEAAPLRFASDSTVPLWAPGGYVSGRRHRGTRVPVGQEVAAGSLGVEVMAMVGSVGTQQAGHTTVTDDSGAGSTGTTTSITVTFSAYQIEERIGVYERTFQNLPPEDLVYPPWYGDHYRSHQIGGLYGYFFGTGAIVDPLVIRAPNGTETVFEDTNPDRGLTSANQGATSNTTEIHGDAVGPPSGEGDPDPIDQRTIAEIEARGTINHAIDELVKAYSIIRTNRYDIDDFLRSYTWRPIATMYDMFGSTNLEINDDGVVVRGVEGFHSRAFGDIDDLRQLVRNVEGRPQQILGLGTTDPDETSSPRRQREAEGDEAISSKLDTRKEKRLAVFRYLQQLLASRGLLG